MGLSENLLPPLDLPALDLSVVFEQLPHPVVLLSPDLRIREVNAAGRRFLGKPAVDLAGVPLFDVLPLPAPGGNDWQGRLRASYAEVLELREPLTLLLSAREATIAEPTSDAAGVATSNASRPAAGTGMWHVCHGPIVDAAGNLVAIATHALALCGIEASIAQVSNFATAQLFSVSRSDGSMVDAPIVQPGAEPSPAMAPAPLAVPENPPGMQGSDHEGNGDQHGLQHNAQAMSILMVEDNQDLRSSTTEMLQFLGHRVVSVPDAELALRQIEAGAFDVLFTDLTLPKMSGAELARHVLQHHRPTRVIITSGYGRAMANAQNLDAVFLPKPYRVADLEEVLAKLPAVRT